MGGGGGFFDNIGNAVTNVARNPIGAVTGSLTNPMGMMFGPVGQVMGAVQGSTPGGGAPGIDMGGQPGYPGYNPVYDKNKQAMLPGYEKKLADNSAGYNKFAGEATRTGPSSWAGLANQQQDALGAAAMEKGAAGAAGANKGAMNALASQGGLSSGARERVAEAGAKNLTTNAQDVTRQTGLNKLQIGVNDEQNRMNSLAALPGMEQNRTNAWEGVAKGDVGNEMMNSNNMNNYNMDAYKAQMAAWAAGKQAQATQNSGPGGKKGSK